MHYSNRIVNKNVAKSNFCLYLLPFIVYNVKIHIILGGIMEKSKMKSKYILILLLSLFTIFGMSMTTLADDTTTSGSSTGTAAGTSAGASGYMSITPRSTQSTQAFSSMALEMYYNGTLINSLTPVGTFDATKVQYKITDITLTRATGTSNPVNINSLQVEYPEELVITEGAIGSSFTSPTTVTTGGITTITYSLSTSSTATAKEAEITTYLSGTSFKIDPALGSTAYVPDSSAIKVFGGTGDFAFYTDPATGTDHVYQRVMFSDVPQLKDASGNITWMAAYNYAKTQAAPSVLDTSNCTDPAADWGYLATITSVAEQNLIYDQIATNCGWLGGTRMVNPDGTMINNESSISTSIGDFDFNASIADKWYWADGPEAGMVFYDIPQYSLGTNTSPNFNFFQNPSTPAYSGTKPGIAPPVSTSAEPNGATDEYCLQFAYPGGTVPYWNDYAYNNNNNMDSFYIEWGYPGSKVQGQIVLDIPQPIVAQYELNWNGADAIDSTLSAPKEYTYFGLIDGSNIVGTVADKVSDTTFVQDTTSYLPVASAGTLLANFEIKDDVLPDADLEFSNERQVVTYVYWGMEMDLEYYSNNGVFPTGDPEGPITIKSRFMEPLEPLPATDHPTKHSSDLTDWTVNTNGSPDNFAETANIIEYQTTTPVSPTVTRFTDASGKMQAYAVWTRNAWDLYFDGNGGQLNGVDTIQIPLVPGTRVANIDISTYLPDGVNQPTWFANAFLGWSNTGNIQNHGTESTPGTFTMTGDVYLKAEWLDLADYVNNYIKDTVIYKGESDAQTILRNSGLYPTYPDLLGNIHPIDLTIEPFYEATIEDGGVAEIRFSLNDPITGGTIGLQKSFVDLYSLNRAYVKGGDTYYMFVGESAPMGANFGVTGVAEFPDFSTRSISRQFFPLNYTDGSVNVNAIGKYDTDFDTLFKDYFGDSYPMHWDALVIVRERAELTKEEKLQVESSEFWVIVTDIYHKMQPGQIIEVNEYNFKDGGNLLTEKVSADAPYDRQIRVTPGPYIYMNPCILDRIKDDKAGSMDVYMPGRSLTFNSWEFETDPTVDGAKYDPRSYFNLRLHLESNEKVSALVPENTANMQFTLSMNRAWMAEPTFTVAVNDRLKAAAAEGKGLYLFNYNGNTNELELVGAMSNCGNGNFSIKMNGAYGSYVILAGLPSNGKYRLTEQTNNLDEGTVQEVITNQQNSGKSVSNGQELNAISNTKSFLGEKAIELSTPTKTETKKESKVALAITSLAIGIVVASGSVIIYKRKYN